MEPQRLQNRLRNACFAFRGYNITNIGKSPELLEVPRYQPILSEVLAQASAIASDTLGQKVELEQRIRRRDETTLDSFPLDVATIVAMEVGHIRLLEELFDIPVRTARMSFGYSIGELPALFLGGVFTMEDLLPISLAFASDAAELAKNVTMGVLFTRAALLPGDIVRHVATLVSAEGKGIIAPSTYLSPNTVLLLGQGKTVDRFRAIMDEYFPVKVSLRKNNHKWPPLHTPIVCEKNLRDRGVKAVYEVPRGFGKPTPPIASCVTGKFSYNEYNAREHMVDWVDRPQLLWDVLYETLQAGVDLVIHVGPEPNLILSTYERVATNVVASFGERFLGKLGRRVFTPVARQTWLNPVLPRNAPLLRTPFVEHIVLEDWLLTQAGVPVTTEPSTAAGTNAEA